MSQYRDKILLIDVGNSFIKWSFCGQNKSISISKFSIDMLPQTNNVWVSCVAHCDLLSGLDSANFVTTDYKFRSFKCGYKKPSDLGVDRFLAMIAAIELYKNQNLLVVDVGSAITFDVVLSSGKHDGGLIMPGLLAIRNSFDKFSTDNDSIQNHNLASNTIDAWLSGTSMMLLNAIKLQIDNYNDKYKDLVILLTGGGGKKVLPYLSVNIELHNDLVLDGLCIYAESTINRS
jgi:type III pantothenate kinase